jgi:hypothetical protein
MRPSFAKKFLTLQSEGAGNTGCALHPRSRVQQCTKENAHEHTGSAGAIRHSLRNGFNGCFELSPVNGYFATVALRVFSQDLTPAPRCQDHTTWPSATQRARLQRCFASTASPPRVCDDHDTPLCRGGMANHIVLILVSENQKYFFVGGLTEKNDRRGDLPVGSSRVRPTRYRWKYPSGRVGHRAHSQTDACLLQVGS